MRKYIPFLILFFIMLLRLYLLCGTDWKECSERKLVTQPPKILDTSTKFLRAYATAEVRKYFPSPHSELLLGMVLGIDDFQFVPKFKEALKDTGTIHIVVVSGYNISLVFDLVIRLIGTKYKLRNLLLAQCITFFYSILSGFEPPVIRAWIMGTIASWGKYYGRNVEALRILIFSGVVMCIINPLYIFSLSFQLSFMATLSLILYSTPINDIFKLINKSNLVLVSDLSTTLAAQILVWPLISIYFGRVSILSPLVNCLLLWTVPIATVLGGVFLFTSFLGKYVALFFYWLTIPALDIFVEGIRFFAQFKIFLIDYKISYFWILVYYFSAFVVAYFFNKRKVNE